MSRREPAWAFALLGALAVGAVRECGAREEFRARTNSASGLSPPWNLELAGPRTLRRLPGVGVQRALALAKARWAEGAGAVFRDLESQPGIGPITARRIAEYLERRAVALPPPRDSLALE